MRVRAPSFRLFAAVLAALVVVLAVGASSSEAAPRTVTGGHLDWGVKESFRDYITGPIALGSITVNSPATTNGDGTFRFPAVSGTYDGNNDTFVQFSGSVQFEGHGGILDLTISDIRMDFNGTTGVLVGDMLSRDLDTGNFVNYPDIDLVDMVLTGFPPDELANSVSWDPIPTFLTAEAEPAWEGFYFEDDPFDPIGPSLQLQNCGADSDGDGVGNNCDTCPNWPNPSQVKPSYALASNDPDCDGFTTAAETSMGTVTTDGCGFTVGSPSMSETWPADLAENNTINISDVLALKPFFGTTVPPTSARFDLVVSGAINISDVLALKPLFGKTCTESGV